MNTPIEHLINSRPLTTYHSLEIELKRNNEKNYLFDLSYYGVLDVNGEKAIDFLQGQLTCDLRAVSDIQMTQGAQCNLKGRILALLDIINWQGIKLVLPKDLLESTQNSLTKTALLSRVSLNENKTLKVFGFQLQNPTDLIPDSAFLPHAICAQASSLNYCCYHLGNGFYIFVVSEEFAPALCKPFIDQDQMYGSLTWHTLRLMNKQLEIYPESRGLFLPHRLGLHETHYISFDKGCYKGQEIIARTHYRATLKHDITLAIINTAQKIFSGQKIFRIIEGTEVGELIDYSELGNNSYLISVSMLKEQITTALFEGHTDPIHLVKYNAEYVNTA